MELPGYHAISREHPGARARAKLYRLGRYKKIRKLRVRPALIVACGLGDAAGAIGVRIWLGVQPQRDFRHQICR